jgi:hypothetical protein
MQGTDARTIPSASHLYHLSELSRLEQIHANKWQHDSSDSDNGEYLFTPTSSRQGSVAPLPGPILARTAVQATSSACGPSSASTRSRKRSASSSGESKEEREKGRRREQRDIHCQSSDAMTCMVDGDIFAVADSVPVNGKKHAKLQSSGNGTSSGQFYDKKLFLAGESGLLLKLMRERLEAALYIDIVENGDANLPTRNALQQEWREFLSQFAQSGSLDIFEFNDTLFPVEAPGERCKNAEGQKHCTTHAGQLNSQDWRVCRLKRRRAAFNQKLQERQAQLWSERAVKMHSIQSLPNSGRSSRL